MMRCSDDMTSKRKAETLIVYCYMEVSIAEYQLLPIGKATANKQCRVALHSSSHFTTLTHFFHIYKFSLQLFPHCTNVMISLSLSLSTLSFSIEPKTLLSSYDSSLQSTSDVNDITNFTILALKTTMVSFKLMTKKCN